MMRIPLAPGAHAPDIPAQPVAPRDAATIILLRDGASGVEAYLLRRQQSMAYAPGMYVFPGGNVDPNDSDASITWIGPSAAEWADRFACSESTARALVCAAVRETFEEAGVLLAGVDADSVVADISGDDWQADREALEHGTLSLAEFLQRRSLVLRTDLLGPWGHWITPESEPRRFDTRFFVAMMPDGQRVGQLPSEADRAAWMPLQQALAAVDSGTAAMFPPTQFTCRELAGFGAASEALTHAASREIVTVRPRIVSDGTRTYAELNI